MITVCLVVPYLDLGECLEVENGGFEITHFEGRRK